MDFKKEQIDFVKGLADEQLKELYRWCPPGALLGAVTAESAKREGNPRYQNWEDKHDPYGKVFTTFVDDYKGRMLG